MFVALGPVSLTGQCLPGALLTPLAQHEATLEDSPFPAAKTMFKGPNQDKESQTKLGTQMDHAERGMELASWNSAL